jgi:hypothetical protein
MAGLDKDKLDRWEKRTKLCTGSAQENKMAEDLLRQITWVSDFK